MMLRETLAITSLEKVVPIVFGSEGAEFDFLQAHGAMVEFVPSVIYLVQVPTAGREYTLAIGVACVPRQLASFQETLTPF